jgi:hypothetical protein
VSACPNDIVANGGQTVGANSTVGGAYLRVGNRSPHSLFVTNQMRTQPRWASVDCKRAADWTRYIGHPQRNNQNRGGRVYSSGVVCSCGHPSDCQMDSPRPRPAPGRLDIRISGLDATGGMKSTMTEAKLPNPRCITRNGHVRCQWDSCPWLVKKGHLKQMHLKLHSLPASTSRAGGSITASSTPQKQQRT